MVMFMVATAIKKLNSRTFFRSYSRTGLFKQWRS